MQRTNFFLRQNVNPEIAERVKRGRGERGLKSMGFNMIQHSGLLDGCSLHAYLQALMRWGCQPVRCRSSTPNLHVLCMTQRGHGQCIESRVARRDVVPTFYPRKPLAAMSPGSARWLLLGVIEVQDCLHWERGLGSGTHGSIALSRTSHHLAM